MRAKAAAAATATVAGCCLYCANERLVEQRANRLDRLRDCAAHTHLQRTAADTAAASLSTGPIVVSGLLELWPAFSDGSGRGWTFSGLRARIGQETVDVGSASGGVPFYAVAHNATKPRAGGHDLAMYIFDSDFSGAKASLLDDVAPLPALAGNDVFRGKTSADHDDRPLWRWLLAGPPGSGSLIHQDPWHYSSWNASVVGVKRWVLFPPDVPQAALHPPREDFIGRCFAVFGVHLPRSAAMFMDEVLPQLRGAGLGQIELLQSPGEVVAFPAGWWHAVVNLSATIAVTESFVRPCDLEQSLLKLRAKGLGDFADIVEAEQQGQISRGDSGPGA